MAKIDRNKLKKARNVLKKKKVFDFSLLLFLLNCSIRTGRIKLKEWKAYTSYNQNGRCYTMPEVPRFDKNGLWRYQQIYFSKHGTLKDTVVHLVRSSSAGMTGEQIGKIVGIVPRSFLHHFRDIFGIRREKHEGVYVYFSDEEEQYRQQSARCLEAISLGKEVSDADAVLILVALIKHHDIGVDDLMALPEMGTKKLSRPAIDRYLKQHGLGKKTPNSRR